MKAKPDLVPDCDIHGEPMRREECPPHAVGIDEHRDLVLWVCTRVGCGRFFHGTVGYRYRNPIAETRPPTPRCQGEGAFLVVQGKRGVYICPVAGCPNIREWHSPSSPFGVQESAARKPSLAMSGARTTR
jgi:hypothetical protein